MQVMQARAWAAAGWSAVSADLPEVREWMAEIAKVGDSAPLNRKQIYSDGMLDRVRNIQPTRDEPSLAQWKEAHITEKRGILMTDGATVIDRKWRICCGSPRMTQ